MSFKPEGWDEIHQSFKDPDGQYVGVAVYALSYAYNTRAIPKTDVPTSAQDFLRPEFNGKVITTYPNAPGGDPAAQSQIAAHTNGFDGIHVNGVGFEIAFKAVRADLNICMVSAR
jgi:ABC-type Fe3+ transport system substrate-binding protein